VIEQPERHIDTMTQYGAGIMEHGATEDGDCALVVITKQAVRHPLPRQRMGPGARPNYGGDAVT